MSHEFIWNLPNHQINMSKHNFPHKHIKEAEKGCRLPKSWSAKKFKSDASDNTWFILLCEIN